MIVGFWIILMNGFCVFNIKELVELLISEFLGVGKKIVFSEGVGFLIFEGL